MTCTRQRRPRRAGQHRADRLRQSFVRLRDHQADARQAALHHTPEKSRPDGPVLRGAHLDAEDLTRALGGHADGHHRPLADHPAVHPHLVVRRINPEIPVRTDHGPRAKGRNDRVELAADPRHFGLRHPVDAERRDQIIDVPRRDAMDVGFLHHGQPFLLRPPARLQQRREGRPRTHVRDRQLDRAHPRVPGPRPVPIPRRRPVAAALVAIGADAPRHLRLHERVGEHAKALAEHVAVLFLQQLAYER